MTIGHGWLIAAVQEAAAAGAQIVVLPEMWNCPYSNDSFPTFAENIDDGEAPSVDALAAAAAHGGVVLVGGTVPESSGGKLYNTCCLFDIDGSLLGKHRYVLPPPVHVFS
jgi:omega-amidase